MPQTALQTALSRVDRNLFPLDLMYGKRNLCHIESGEGAPAGQGIAICSIPRKYEALAEAMVEAINEAVRTATPTP